MSDLPNYDELVAVRLELSRVRDQRDALESALKSDIMKIAKSSIYQAAVDAGKDDDADALSCLCVELDDVRAENESLRYKIEFLSKAGIALGMCLPDTDEANKAYQAFERIVNGGRS